MALAALLAARGTERRAGWVVLAVVAGDASIDEFTQLHERLAVVGAPIADALGWELWYTWVIPGALVAILVAALLLPLFRSLPRESQRLVLAGGALFLVGALGFEVLGGLVAGSSAPAWAYVLVTMVEEALEMVGVVLAIGGVLAAIERRRPGGLTA